MKWKLLLVMSLVSAMPMVGAAQSSPQETPARKYWVDTDTSLMWAAKDNGKDVSWAGAMEFCRALRLGSYSGWRLASLVELQSIFDSKTNAPGLVGRRPQEAMTWHVKGDLFLTGNEWSSSYRTDDRGHPSGYVYYFDFNEGKSNDDPTGWPYSYVLRRALCVRGSGDPLSGQRKQ